MKRKLFSFLFLLLLSFAYTQEQDYKAVLESFYTNSKTNFKDIIGKKTDSASVFFPCNIKVDVGEIKIGKFPNTTSLNWIIPLNKSQKIQAVTKEFIKSKFSDKKRYKIASDGTEEEGEMMTNIYEIGTEKPLLIFQTIYYKNADNPEKNNFAIQFLSK